MKTVLPFLLILIAGVLDPLPCRAQLPGTVGRDKESVVAGTPYWSATGVKPGGEITLAVVLEIRKPYHINANTANEPFIPTTAELADGPAELRGSTAIFPDAHEIDFGVGADREKIRVFSDRITIYFPMSVTPAIRPGKATVQVKIGYQACDDKQCLRPTSTLIKTEITILDPSSQAQPTHPEVFEGLKAAKNRVSVAFFGWDFKFEASKLWLLLIVAAIGGVLLNFTPCVLPLIPIKIMGLSHAAGNRRRSIILGLSLAAGVIAFWLGLAIAISTISGFNATNKLFQYPAFTMSVGVVICIMAVGMCGLFAVSLPQWIYRFNPSQESTSGSFFFGIMTAVLSTPCTAPFMGAAAAWSATQTPWITMSTFAAIGAGMAMPYLLLSSFPFLVSRMPKTGPASELIKHVMGLLMLAAGAYFLGTGLAGLTAKPPDPPTDVYWWAVAFFIASAGVWLAWRTFQITSRPAKRLLFGGLGTALVVIAVAFGLRFTAKSPIKWVYYTPQRLASAQSQSQAVVLEFTAAWCLNCHLLEQAVLHQPKVVALLNSKNVTPIKVDITGNNVEGNQKLVDVGRRTIPYLVIYSPSGQQVFASDAYTVEQLTNALHQVGVTD